MRAATIAALRKGENVTLSALADDLGFISVVLEWGVASEPPLDADVSVLLLGDDGRVRSNDDFVFFNQRTGGDGAIRLRGKTSSAEDQHTAFSDVVDVDMDDVPDSVDRIIIGASAESTDGEAFGRLAYLRLRVLRGSDAEELLRFEVTDATTETAFVLGEVYRRSGQWKFRAIGQGYDDGLAALARDYGVEVDSTEDGTAEPEVGAETESGQVAAQTPDGPPPAEADSAASGTVAPGSTAPQPRARPREKRQGVSTRKTRTARRLSSSKGRRLAALDAEQEFQRARLFPVAGIGGGPEQERRATSALLAVAASVREFGRALTSAFGAPAGQVETFVEVPFDLGGQPYRPDGMIKVARGQKRWTALLEVKTGDSDLRPEQVSAYLDIAREQRFDAVITISNLITAPDERHPVAIDGRKTRKVSVHHLSWAEIIFRCQYLLENNAVADPTQEFILTEFLRYLDHGRSGAQTFENMGTHWVSVRDSVSAGRLVATDKGLASVAERFDQLAHYLCLHLGGVLGVEVIPHTNRRMGTGQRRQQLADELCRCGTLSAAMRIPGTVGPLNIVADLRAGRFLCSIVVDAPKQGRPLTRVNWILRQLADANGNLSIETFEQGSKEVVRAERLALAQKKPDVLIADGQREIRAFRISLNAQLGTKRGSGSGTFIKSVIDALEKFYEEVVQNLREWRIPAGTESKTS